jgi:hypothetical protein
VSDVRRTVLYYGEWASRSGRFRRLDDGFELWIGGGELISRVLGAVGRKRIADSSIDAIFTTCGLVRIVFDEDDEVILRQEILDDFPRVVLDRVGVKPEVPPASSGLGNSAQRYIDQMLARQRALGPVSFKGGRRPTRDADPPWT